MALAAGTKLGPYEILAPLGAGGMGEVYRARDTRLDRTVAVKVIPSQLSFDAVSRQRFEREAKAISALQHPNICTLYDVGRQEGIDYLVMEYLEGTTLAIRLGRGALPVTDVLRYGMEIADALDTAHRRGIVHRDLKPGNIFLTAHGECKVLDFGLAMLEEEPSSEAATVTRPEVLTSPGIAVGTVAYMSPEQARGEALDARTDIFSLGAVLYEMATGKVAFPGRTSALVFKAILDEMPTPATRINANLPEQLEAVIGKALEKDRDLRYQSAAELRTDLKRLARDSESARHVTSRTAAPSRQWTWRKKLVIVTAGSVVIAAAVIGGLLYRRPNQAKQLTGQDTIVLGDFTNTTGDPVFDDTLKQGLAVQLEQSPFLQLVSDHKVNETLKLMGRSAGERLTPEITREICLRTGNKAMLTGSIAGLGAQYVVGLKAVNCVTGDVLAETQEQATDKEAVLKALGAAASNLRGKLGESLSSLQKYDTPLMEATTTSLEALQAYSLGQRTWALKGPAAAVPFTKRAIELDPNFATAYASLSTSYENLGETQRAIEYARKAYELRDKASELERLTIETNYFEVDGELEKAVQVVEQWRQAYPRDSRPVRELTFMYGDLGDHEAALEQARNALQMGPHTEIYYFAAANAYINLGRFDDAQAVFKDAQQRGVPQGEFLRALRYQLAFLKGDAAEMAQLGSGAVDTPGLDFLVAAQADTEFWHGRLKSARELTQRAMDLAQSTDAKEAGATYQAIAGLREAEAGNFEKARTEVQEALKLGRGRDLLMLAALALARAGDITGAERLAAGINRDYQLDTLAQKYWLPSIRAAIALQRKDPAQAIEILQPAETVELGQPTISAMQIALCPAYMRGQVYLALRDGKRAAAEFQKFMDHRGLVGNFSLGAMARLGLARAYALEGDEAKARAAYQDFLTLWKDADPDVPVFKQAKAEAIKLQ